MSNSSCAGIVLVTTALLSTSASSIAQESAWKPAPGVPPSELRWQGKHKASLAFQDESITGQARWDLRGKLVSILWTHEPTRSAGAQEISTSYWPTAITALGDGRTLVVAGKRPDGNTVVESWRLLAPVLVPKDGPDKEYLLEPAVVESVDTLYDAAVQGRDLVAHVVRKLGSTSGLLVQFVDSRDVYELDFAAKPPTLAIVASPQSATTIPAVPQLRQRYTRAWAGDHKAKGYVYVLANDGQQGVASLVLVDKDRDGKLDGSLLVSEAEWASGGWGAPANYQ